MIPKLLRRLSQHLPPACRSAAARMLLPKRSVFDTRHPLEPTVGLPRDFLKDPRQVAAAEADRDIAACCSLKDPAVLASIERDAIPLPTARDREGYFGDQHLLYWLSGRADLQTMRSVGHIPDDAFESVLDLGGASGRFARHVLQHSETALVTVADLNVNHVDWIERYFPSRARGLKVSAYPHLPLPDKSVRLCVAFSVFTHIDAYESGWLAEIRRVLADDGWAYVTIHSEHTWAALPDIYLYQILKKDAAFVRKFRPGEPLPEDFLVFDYNPSSIEYNCNVFTHSERVRRRWGKWFEIVSILPQAHSYQTAVVLKR